MILLKFSSTLKDEDLGPTKKNVPEKYHYRLYQLKRKSFTNFKA